MTPSAQPSKPAVIGIIGLGLMGRALAVRLCKSGFQVRGLDTDARCFEAFMELGGEFAENANAVLGTCNVVLLSLPSHFEVGSVLTEGVSQLRAGQIILDTTTGGPDAAVECARELAVVGVSYLDATISGNSFQALEGDVVWMVGGECEAFDRCYLNA